MGVTKGEIEQTYPYLYHMAAPGSWNSICKHGLLSTSALLDLHKVSGTLRVELEECHRKEYFPIQGKGLDKAWIRDQKPMSETKLSGSLLDNLTSTDWFKMLNERVFFWLTEDRLNTMRNARAYIDQRHLILKIDTAQLLNHHFNSIELSPMNSGNTSPFAHPRGKKTFTTPPNYPWEERKVKSDYYKIVELTVPGGVPNICNYVISAVEKGGKTPDVVFK